MNAIEAFNTAMGTPVGRLDPYPYFEVIRADGPVVRHSPSLLVVVGYPEVDQVLRDQRLRVHDTAYLHRVWPGGAEHPSIVAVMQSILRTNAPDHERVRRLVGASFTPRRLAALHGIVERLAADLADRLAEVAEDGVVDFMREFAYLLPVTVICELLGIPEADREWFRPLATAVVGSVEPMMADFAAADAASQTLSTYFVDLVAARRAKPDDALISAMVATHDADPALMSLDELLSNITLLLLSGFESTTNLLGNGLWALLERPAALAALRADPVRTDAYVEEMLRFDPPVQLTSRHIDEPMEVLGEEMPADAEICVLFGAANRDPRRFAAPAAFDPDRNGGQSSFGGGAHFCIGAALARMEARIAFPLFLSRFPDLTAAGDPVRRDRITLRGFESLPIRL